jgi:hypothetical protein
MLVTGCCFATYPHQLLRLFCRSRNRTDAPLRHERTQECAAKTCQLGNNRANIGPVSPERYSAEPNQA